MKNLIILGAFISMLDPVFAQQNTGERTPDKKSSGKRTEQSIPPEFRQAQIVKAIEDEMVPVEGGGFTMGCTNSADSDCYYWEKPAHPVAVSTFYLAKYPVTQEQWRAIMGNKPWYSKDCDQCPVENVTWFDAQVFIYKLSQLTGKNYRLPTEAEWEYAAGGGNKHKGYRYAGDNNPAVVAWFSNNSGGKVQPAGQKKPNELGLYDMSGNVWQWCADWFDEKYYATSPANNPLGPIRAKYRVLRGGSWWGKMDDCRVINRDRYPPDAKDDDVGFRLARD